MEAKTQKERPKKRDPHCVLVASRSNTKKSTPSSHLGYPLKSLRPREDARQLGLDTRNVCVAAPRLLLQRRQCRKIRLPRIVVAM